MAVDAVRVAKPDLDLGRMDIDVDLLGGDLQVEKRHGHPADHQQAAIGLVEGMAERPVTDIAAPQEQELSLGGRAALRRVGDVTPQMHPVKSALDPQQRVGQLAAEEGRDPVAGAGDRRQVVDDLGPRAEGQVDLRVRQGDP